MRPQRRPGGEDGLTLVELLITLTVTLIGLAGLVAMHTTVVKGNAGAQHYAEANAVAERTVEELRGLSVGRLEARHGPLPLDLSLSGIPGRVGVVYERRAVIDAVAANPDLIRVHVEVGWTDPGATPDTGRDRLLRYQVIRTRAEVL